MTLEELLKEARALELSESQARGMEDASNVSFVRNYWGKAKHKSGFKNDSTKSPTPAVKPLKKCFKCGGPYPHDSQCPAKDKRCNKCHKYGHYAR